MLKQSAATACDMTRWLRFGLMPFGCVVSPYHARLMKR